MVPLTTQLYKTFRFSSSVSWSSWSWWVPVRRSGPEIPAVFLFPHLKIIFFWLSTWKTKQRRFFGHYIYPDFTGDDVKKPSMGRRIRQPDPGRSGRGIGRSGWAIAGWGRPVLARSRRGYLGLGSKTKVVNKNGFLPIRGYTMPSLMRLSKSGGLVGL